MERESKRHAQSRLVNNVKNTLWRNYSYTLESLIIKSQTLSNKRRDMHSIFASSLECCSYITHYCPVIEATT